MKAPKPRKNSKQTKLDGHLVMQTKLINKELEINKQVTKLGSLRESAQKLAE